MSDSFRRNSTDRRLWLRIDGWQEIVNYLNSIGYKVISVSKEPCNLTHVVKRNNLPLEDTINTIRHADFYMGASSGLSWIAWSLNVPTIVICGFTALNAAPKGMLRVVNTKVCHACMGDITNPVDKSWTACPRKKDYECSTSITPEMVKEEIRTIKERKQHE
jgi:autotransporter strand-loop-strand O-heptosyltransferase